MKSKNNRIDKTLFYLTAIIGYLYSKMKLSVFE